MSYEEALRIKMCKNCHLCIVTYHPEEKFASLEYFKCSICGYTIQIVKPKYDYINKKFKDE